MQRIRGMGWSQPPYGPSAVPASFVQRHPGHQASLSSCSTASCHIQYQVHPWPCVSGKNKDLWLTYLPAQLLV